MAHLVEDRYELIEVIASGGMATVWRALDTRLGRHVALKRPHPGRADDRWRERLEREARLAAGISHPNLVTVFDTGSDDDGPFLVMELVEGPTLADDIPSPSVSSVTAMGAQLAAALAAVHAAGIVHRDIKPANIILGADGPLLTDFGIARRPDASDRVTMEGAVVTTPSYAAPEVLAGGEPTPAGDVFSLGAVLYEMLSGSSAFRGSDRTPPPPLSDPAVDELIRSALDTDPTLRPTAADLAGALGTGAPTVLLGPGRHERGGSGETARLSPIPAATSTPSARDPDPRPRWLLPLLAVTALIALGGILAMAFGDPTSPTSSTGPLTAQPPVSTTPPSTGSESPTTPPTTTPPTTTLTTTLSTTTTSPPTTTPPPADPLEAALMELQDFEDMVVGIPPPDLKPKDRDRLLESIAELERALTSGGGDNDDDDDDEGEGVSKALDDLEEGIEKIRDPDVVTEALIALDELRRAIDEVFGDGGGGGGGDDD